MGGTLGPSPNSATLAVTIIPVGLTGGAAAPGQVVDERAPEHVEKTGSKPSMDA